MISEKRGIDRIICLIVAVMVCFSVLSINLDFAYASKNKDSTKASTTQSSGGTNTTGIREDAQKDSAITVKQLDTKGTDNAAIAFNLDVTYMKALMGLDIQDVGTVSKAMHMAAVALYAGANGIYSLQVIMTFGCAIFVQWSKDMPWFESMVNGLNKAITKGKKGGKSGIAYKLFGFNKSKSSPIYLAISFTFILIILALLRGRTMEGFGRFWKLILLIAIVTFLSTNGLNFISQINNTSVKLSNSIIKSVGLPDIPSAIWDINAVQPWKILQFGDADPKGKDFNDTEKGSTEASDQAKEDGASAANASLSSRTPVSAGSTTAAAASKGQLDWNEKESEEDTSGGDIKISSLWTEKIGMKPKGYGHEISRKDTMLGSLSKYRKEGTKKEYESGSDGSKMVRMLVSTAGSREKIATAMAYNEHGYFELTTSKQGPRLAMAMFLFILSLPITVVVFLVFAIILALKMIAIILFFLWPLFFLYAMMVNSLDAVKKWLVTVCMFYGTGIIIEFLISILLGLTLQMFNSKQITFGYWSLSCIVIMSMFIGGFILYPQIMKIMTGGVRQAFPGESRMRNGLTGMFKSGVSGSIMGRQVAKAINDKTNTDRVGNGGVVGGKMTAPGEEKTRGSEAEAGTMRNPKDMSTDELRQELGRMKKDEDKQEHDKMSPTERPEDTEEELSEEVPDTMEENREKEVPEERPSETEEGAPEADSTNMSDVPSAEGDERNAAENGEKPDSESSETVVSRESETTSMETPEEDATKATQADSVQDQGEMEKVQPQEEPKRQAETSSPNENTQQKMESEKKSAEAIRKAEEKADKPVTEKEKYAEMVAEKRRQSPKYKAEVEKELAKRERTEAKVQKKESAAMQKKADKEIRKIEKQDNRFERGRRARVSAAGQTAASMGGLAKATAKPAVDTARQVKSDAAKFGRDIKQDVSDARDYVAGGVKNRAEKVYDRTAKPIFERSTEKINATTEKINDKWETRINRK